MVNVESISSVVIEIIVSLIVIMAVIVMLYPELIPKLLASGEMSEKPRVKFVDDPDVTDEPNIVISPPVGPYNGFYEYEISFDGTVEYVGKMEDILGTTLPSIRVVPVIDFKGGSRKASVIDSVEDYFVLTNVPPEAEDDPPYRQFTGTFAATIQSLIKPVVRFDNQNSYEGQISLGDTYLFTSGDNQLTVTLSSVKRYELSYSLIDIYTLPCEAVLRIECGESTNAPLRGDCSSDKMLDCERSMKMCGGDVYIGVNHVSCSRKTADIILEFSTESDYVADYDIGISFWKYPGNGNCVMENDGYEVLWSRCGDEDFLGKYVFNEELKYWIDA